MKIILQHIHLRSQDRVVRMIENRIFDLANRLVIEEATIRLEHRAESSPPFHVRIHLTVPGPDLRAEANDHTVRTALDQALAEILSHLAERARNRRRGSRGLRQLTAHRRSTGGVASR